MAVQFGQAVRPSSRPSSCCASEGPKHTLTHFSRLLITMFSFFKAPLGPRRIAYTMPLVWPVISRPQWGADGRAAVRHTLDTMLSCSTGFDLILALMSDAYWYDESVKKAYKKSVDAAVAADSTLPPLFYASTILAKQIVRHLYDLSTGQLMQQRVADGLSLVRYLAALGPSANINDAAAVDGEAFAFEHYAGSRDSNGDCSIDVWQGLKCLVAHGVMNAIFDLKWASTVDAATAAAPEADTQFCDTLAYQTDLMSHLLRSTMAVSGATQQLSNRMLEYFDKCEGQERPFKALPVGIIKRAGQKKDWETVWRNYYFDLSAMWTMAAMINGALMSGQPNEIIRAMSCARSWTIGGGFVESVRQLRDAIGRKKAGLSRPQRGGPSMKLYYRDAGALASTLGVLEDIQHTTSVLHGLYLRLWDVSMSFCNTKRHGRGNVERSMARVASAVLMDAPAGVSVIQETPECGGGATGAVMMDNWPLTLLTPELAGLVCPENGQALLGADLTDLKIACCSAQVSPAVTRTDSHIWAAVTRPEAWASLARVLPQPDDICTRLLAWRPDWMLNAEDLAEAIERAQEKQRAAQKATHKEELDTALSALK